MVAVAPGAAPPDGPSGDGTLDFLFSGRGEAADRAGSAGRARSGVPEAGTTTIDLSTAADPVPGRRGVVPIRHIVGARAGTGRWLARARRGTRVGGWVAGAITVGAGLTALWVLLFTTIPGGDVWLGRPLTPARHNQNATEQNVTPPGSGAGVLQPSPSTAPAKPSPTAAKAGTKAAAPTDTSGQSRGGSSTGSSGSGTSGSGTSGSGTSGSGTSGSTGSDDPPGDDSGGTRTTTATSGSDSSGSGSSGSDSSGSGSSGSGSSGSGSSGGSDE